MAKTSKRMKKVYEGVDKTKVYAADEAIKLLKGLKSTKLDETLEISMNLGVDPRHADQNVRGVVSLPHGTGKSVTVAVFAKDANADAAKKAGADRVGAEDLVEAISKGEEMYDRFIATPDMMGVVGRVAKILGPKGLMPNPKLGTVTPNVDQAVQNAKAGQVEFRVEKQGIVHAGIGKCSFDEKQLTENFAAFVDAIKKAKPTGVKGTYIKKASLTSTMGPGLTVEIN